MITCNKCKTEKLESCFSPSRIKKQDYICKCCSHKEVTQYRKNGKGKEWKTMNQAKPEYRKTVRNRHSAKRDMWTGWLKENGYGKCFLCGYDVCVWAIEYHHRDSATKSFNISTWLSQKACVFENQQIIKQELNKCDVLCANCHRELHYNLKKEAVK